MSPRRHATRSTRAGARKLGSSCERTSSTKAIDATTVTIAAIVA
jgi:hypothetical protein